MKSIRKSLRMLFESLFTTVFKNVVDYIQRAVEPPSTISMWPVT